MERSFKHPPPPPLPLTVAAQLPFAQVQVEEGLEDLEGLGAQEGLGAREGLGGSGGLEGLGSEGLEGLGAGVDRTGIPGPAGHVSTRSVAHSPMVFEKGVLACGYCSLLRSLSVGGFRSTVCRIMSEWGLAEREPHFFSLPNNIRDSPAS